jgi:hypothetical protein
MSLSRATRNYAVQVSVPPQPEVFRFELCACKRLGDANAIALRYYRSETERGSCGSGALVRVVDLRYGREILSPEAIIALVSPTATEEGNES